MRSLYPTADPYATHAWPVSGGHVLNVNESGTPHGEPVLLLHGGPGSGCTPLIRRFLDPARYRVVCIDQRGAGRSAPRGETRANTTADLLADLQSVREGLGIERWLVVGGSWGATLALAYALHEPHAVTGILMRAVFLAREQDVADFFAGSGDLRAVAAKALATGSPEEQARAACAWSVWESGMSSPQPPSTAAAHEPTGEALAALIGRFRVQSHYLEHRCWLDAPPLLDRLDALPDVPITLLHGTHDRVCRPEAARTLCARAPQVRLHWVEGSGHDPTHPAMVDAMVSALDHWSERRSFDATWA